MSYVIKRIDQGGGYLSKPGLTNVYTKNIEKIRVFPSRELAERSLCIGNEIVIPLNEI